MVPLSVARSKSLPTKASEVLTARDMSTGTDTSPNGNHDDTWPSPSWTNKATRSGVLSSRRATWRRGVPPAPPRPGSQATAAADKRAPSARGSLPGEPAAGMHAQMPPAPGRGPGHETRWPSRVTRKRPSLSASPHEAPTNGGRPERPERVKGSAMEAAPGVCLTCTAAPKPRLVNAATTLPPLSTGGPHASSWGSKKLGHSTASGACAGATSAVLGPSTARRASNATERPAPRPAPCRHGPAGAERRLAPSVSLSASRFSSCQAICSGIQGLAPAGHGKPIGVPSSCGSRDRRVIGGRDQCGAVTSACSPRATSMMQPPMRKTHATHSIKTMEETSLHGWMCCVCTNGGTSLRSCRLSVYGELELFMPRSDPELATPDEYVVPVES
mmetsp:Transcript_78349/g.253779  ORF Transcript_78349/g.253779 Transcript_78349/m.253779 type:complete len:387 (+) Transcript_78349:894-2054(+)